MIPQNTINEKTLPEINIQFINALRELKASTLLKRSGINKNSRSRNGDGGRKRTAFEIFQFLLMLVFEGANLFRFLGSKKQDIACSKSTYYRFLSNCHYNWRRFVLLLSGKAAVYFRTLTRPERVKCFVLDDSVIPRGKSKKVELLSFVYDHVARKTVRGFNLLLLGGLYPSQPLSGPYSLGFWNALVLMRKNAMFWPPHIVNSAFFMLETQL